jgi:hypothetical protein
VQGVVGPAQLGGVTADAPRGGRVERAMTACSCAIRGSSQAIIVLKSGPTAMVLPSTL